jgi:hypothetical protein
MMRPAYLAAFVVLAAGCAAESPPSDSAAATPDFSGVYAPAPFVGRPEIFLPEQIPFNAAAQQKFAEFDPLVGNRRIEDDCARETVPAVLWLGAPMEITQGSDNIVLRFERGGLVRDIPLNQPLPSGAAEASELGISVARWEGAVLTIETAHMSSGEIITNQGYPISTEATVTERYWREPGQMDLQLEVSIDDPVNYTDVFTLGRVWVWAPDEQVQTWECVSLGTREGDIDIDELARQLEQL